MPGESTALVPRGNMALVHQPRPMFYRITESRFTSTTLMLILHEYPLIGVTPCGVWIDEFGCKRFVKLTARKRFACPTVAEAMASYHARKSAQVRILRQQLARAEAACRLQSPGDVVRIG